MSTLAATIRSAIQDSIEVNDSNTQKLVDLMKNSGPATNKTGFMCNRAPKGAEYTAYHGTDCSYDADLVAALMDIDE